MADKGINRNGGGGRIRRQQGHRSRAFHRGSGLAGASQLGSAFSGVLIAILGLLVNFYFQHRRMARSSRSAARIERCEAGATYDHAQADRGCGADPEPVRLCWLEGERGFHRYADDPNQGRRADHRLRLDPLRRRHARHAEPILPSPPQRAEQLARSLHSERHFARRSLAWSCSKEYDLYLDFTGNFGVATGANSSMRRTWPGATSRLHC